VTGSPVAGSRIAILCGHFSPDVGYQEVDLARAYTRMGAEVRVVTSTRVSQNARALTDRKYRAGIERLEGYEVVRVEPRLAFGPNVVGRSVATRVTEFDPNFMILIGPGKLFGIELFSPTPSTWRKIAVMQDNSEDGRSSASGGLGKQSKSLAHRFVKRPVYRRVVRHADRIVLNVPETRTTIENWLGPNDRALLGLKAIDLRLGFDPDQFFFDRQERRGWRSSHGIADQDLLLATCTRVVPSKKLEDVIEAVLAVRARGLPIRYALAGMLEDEYAHKLRSLADRDPHAFLLLPALNQADMRRLFSAADLGHWPRAAITIQQAMGTGLPVILRPRPTVSQLLRPGENGWYLDPDESLEDALARAAGDVQRMSREPIAELNRSYLSYDTIAAAMLKGMAEYVYPRRC